MDPRFNTRSDPRFKQLPSKLKKVRLDERFKTILHDSSFVTEVDPRSGRRKTSQTNKAQLKNLYISNEDKASRKPKSFEEDNSSLEENYSEEPVSTDEGDLDGESFSSQNQLSSSDSDSDDLDDFPTLKSSIWDRYDASIPMSTKTSSRLAILGCDWDSVSSQDLYFLLSSYAENVGRINRIAIYMSEFGKEQLEVEARNGPILNANLRREENATSTRNDDLSPHGEGDEEYKTKLAEALREYEKQRSRYYFAVIECDNKDTACYLYNELEGLDCDFTIDDLDIRFIPDEYPPFTDTYPRAPRCVATRLSTRGYQPGVGFVSALKHSKPKFLWDETPLKRTRFFRKRFTASEMAEQDLKDYLASCSDEDSNQQDILEEGVKDEVICTGFSIEGIELPQGLEPSTTSNPSVEHTDDIEAYRRKLLGKDVGSGSTENHDPTKFLKPDYEIELFVPGCSQQSNCSEKITNVCNTITHTKITRTRNKKSSERRSNRGSLSGISAHESVQTLPEKSNLNGRSTNHLSFSPNQCLHEPEVNQDEIDDIFIFPRNTELELKQKKKNKKKIGKKGHLITDTNSVDFTKDERFKDYLRHPEFTVDPTHPKFKMSNVYKKFLTEKAAKKKINSA